MNKTPPSPRYPRIDLRDDALDREAGWRRYQRRLQGPGIRHRRSRRLRRIALLGLLLLGAAYGLKTGLPPAQDYLARHLWPSAVLAKTSAPDPPPRPGLDRKALRQLLARSDPGLLNLSDQSLELTDAGSTYRLETSLDPELQQYMRQKLDPRTSRHIALLALDARTGRVLAMVGLSKTEKNVNLCTVRPFPAASLVKIVTAVAAVEACGLNENSKLTYNGRKYTLYRSQLKQKTNRWTRRITFKDSFAQSINPVFGKIGVHCVGAEALTSWSDAFGFNRAIDFELPVATSQLEVTPTAFGLAEISCGFNRRTTISPLHAALLAATIANDGRMVPPTLVERVTGPSGTPLYSGGRPQPRQVISADTARVLQRLMRATVDSGTGRKVFKGHRRHKVLSRLEIGGKTGSIDNAAHDARIDWFVGFAREKKGSRQMAVAAVVAHEKYIGVRAGQYARLAIQRYFRNVSRPGRLSAAGKPVDTGS